MSNMDDLVNTLLGGVLNINKALEPNTREDDFINHMTGGKMPKADNLAYWLRLQLNLVGRFHEYGIFFVDTRGREPKRLPIRQVAKIMIEHYLMGQHSMWFIAGAISGHPAADMEKVVQRLLEVKCVKKLLDGDLTT